jgi:peptidoglycan/LPS O-acetylase OafA/YrhL
MVLLAKSTGMTLNNPQAWLWSDLVWQFTLLQAWGVTADPTWNAPSWSISAEWFAYLLFPMIAPFMVRVRDAKTALALAIVSIGCTALVFWLAGWTLNTWVGVPALTRVSGEFVCGAALYRVLALWDKPAKSACDILGMGAFVAFLLGASIGVQDFVLIGLLALTIFGAAISRGVLAQNLGSRPLVWLGEISYSIYLVHFPLLLATRRVWEHLGFAEWIIAGRILAFLATVSLVIALAAMLFYVVERPARVRLRDLMGELQ